jgi:hypothetical protein
MYLQDQQLWMQYDGLICFNGGGVLPPRWGLGFTQRVRSLFTADRVKAEADSFKQKGYPHRFYWS